MRRYQRRVLFFFFFFFFLAREQSLRAHSAFRTRQGLYKKTCRRSDREGEPRRKTGGPPRVLVPRQRITGGRATGEATVTGGSPRPSLNKREDSEVKCEMLFQQRIRMSWLHIGSRTRTISTSHTQGGLPIFNSECRIPGLTWLHNSTQKIPGQSRLWTGPRSIRTSVHEPVSQNALLSSGSEARGQWMWGRVSGLTSRKL